MFYCYATQCKEVWTAYAISHFKLCDTFSDSGLVAGYVLLREHQISKNKEHKMAFSTPIKEHYQHLIPHFGWGKGQCRYKISSSSGGNIKFLKFQVKGWISKLQAI